MFDMPDISCPKNKRKILGLFTVSGHHKLELVHYQPWGDPDWHQYQVWSKCKLCGARMYTFGISETEMIRTGILKGDESDEKKGVKFDG